MREGLLRNVPASPQFLYLQISTSWTTRDRASSGSSAYSTGVKRRHSEPSGAPYGTEKFFFGAGKEGVLGGVQRAVNDNEGIVPGIEGLPYDLIITVFVVAEESRHEDLL